MNFFSDPFQNEVEKDGEKYKGNKKGKRKENIGEKTGKGKERKAYEREEKKKI